MSGSSRDSFQCARYPAMRGMAKSTGKNSVGKPRALQRLRRTSAHATQDNRRKPLPSEVLYGILSEASLLLPGQGTFPFLPTKNTALLSKHAPRQAGRGALSIL